MPASTTPSGFPSSSLATSSSSISTSTSPASCPTSSCQSTSLPPPFTLFPAGNIGQVNLTIEPMCLYIATTRNHDVDLKKLKFTVKDQEDCTHFDISSFQRASHKNEYLYKMCFNDTATSFMFEKQGFLKGVKETDKVFRSVIFLFMAKRKVQGKCQGLGEATLGGNVYTKFGQVNASAECPAIILTSTDDVEYPDYDSTGCPKVKMYLMKTGTTVGVVEVRGAEENHFKEDFYEIFSYNDNSVESYEDPVILRSAVMIKTESSIPNNVITYLNSNGDQEPDGTCQLEDNVNKDGSQGVIDLDPLAATGISTGLFTSPSFKNPWFSLAIPDYYKENMNMTLTVFFANGTTSVLSNPNGTVEYNAVALKILVNNRNSIGSEKRFFKMRYHVTDRPVISTTFSLPSISTTTPLTPTTNSPVTSSPGSTSTSLTTTTTSTTLGVKLTTSSIQPTASTTFTSTTTTSPLPTTQSPSTTATSSATTSTIPTTSQTTTLSSTTTSSTISPSTSTSSPSTTSHTTTSSPTTTSIQSTTRTPTTSSSSTASLSSSTSSTTSSPKPAMTPSSSSTGRPSNSPTVTTQSATSKPIPTTSSQTNPLTKTSSTPTTPKAATQGINRNELPYVVLITSLLFVIAN
ncbi:hypothetical protein L596_012412 [Steinernema carpocapsae]|uniref:Uncharacterized protein n=1 Tax=Steinernema carpocapsae TaxID=34508 RepID=A0A4U5NXU8_STECR|nr:hypothetical protein L596_012412 [Steinernema carpocapsae]